MSVTRELAEWVAGLRASSVPERTCAVVTNAILDTLGAALHGTTMPWAATVRQWAERTAGNGSASAWGAARRTLAPADAALVNGVAAHAFELDDYHQSKIHPGAVVIPAALALAEAIGASGERLVTAVAAGYEVMIRTAFALDPVSARLRGWHLTGVAGPLGAAAACASILGLDAEHTAWALGLGGTQGAGLFAFNADGTMSKRLHPGRAAHAGVLAAELAAADFTGPTMIYEAEDGGFLKAHSDAPAPGRLVEDLGRRWHTDDVSFKPYSCCGSLHSYIDAALALRDRFRARPEARPRVRAGLSRIVDVQCGFPYEPSTVMHAQMSLRYCAATALVEGSVLPPQFAPEKLHDPLVVELARRIELVPDARLDDLYPARFAGWVEVDGERADVLDPTGSVARPMDRAALAKKFRGLVAGLLAPDAIEAVESRVHEIGCTPARDLVDVLRGK